MKFHLIQPGMIGRKTDIEKGMAGQNKELYQRYLEEIRGYIGLADEPATPATGTTNTTCRSRGSRSPTTRGCSACSSACTRNG